MTNSQHGLGAHPSTPDIRDFLHAAPYRVLAALPETVSLRSQMPPVYDQGDLGSCTSNSAAAALRYAYAKAGKQIDDPSRLMIYYDERVIEGTVREDSGASIKDSAVTLLKQGACPEREWPYNVGRFTKKPTKACYKDAARIASYARVPQDQTQMMGVLADLDPILVGFSVYQSFERVGRDGLVPLPKHGEKLEGGHAVLVVGYRTQPDGSLLFEVRNSWSADWGDGGYCWMPGAYLLNSKLAWDFWRVAA